MNKLSVLTKDTAGLNSGAETIAKMIRLEDIKLHPHFQNLFPIKPAVKMQIIDRIKKYGFDKSQPLIIWKEKGVLLDGHTRRVAADECGLVQVPVSEKSFSTLEDALEYVYGLQIGRRNLSDAELFTAMTAFDQLKNRGRVSSSESVQAEKGKSAEHTAKVLGTSATKVERIRAIEKKASDEVKTAVKNGEISINQAYSTIKEMSAKVSVVPEIEENQGSAFDIEMEVFKETDSDLTDEEFRQVELFIISLNDSVGKLIATVLRKLLLNETKRRNQQ